MTQQIDNNATDLNNDERARRQFLKATALTGGGLSMAMVLPGCATLSNEGLNSQKEWQANAWIKIDPKNHITFTLDRTEMGQGTMTGLTCLIAEELEVEPHRINIEFAGVDSRFVNPKYQIQATGGSTSMAISWDKLRLAAAATRMILQSSAATIWRIRPEECVCHNGVITNPRNNETFSYGQLTRRAADFAIPADIPLKKPQQFKYIGKYNQRLDVLKKSQGEAPYGIDIDLPNMAYAIVARPPAFGQQVKSFNQGSVQSVFGIYQVFEIKTGVAIVAETYWAAQQARKALEIEWDENPMIGVNNESIFAKFKQDADDNDGSALREEGDIEESLEQASEIIEAEYQLPFLAHCTLEPQNCTIQKKNGKMHIWVPTQAPDTARVAAARSSSFSLSDVEINVTYIGGGYGRRLTNDFVAEAAEIADKIDQPVKLLWSREDDIQHDFYRPANYHRVKASINKDGELDGWQHKLVTAKLYDWFLDNAGGAQYPFAPKFTYPLLDAVAPYMEDILAPTDTSAREGADDVPYDIKNIGAYLVKSDPGVPAGYWRSVGYSFNSFVSETFIDTIAEKLGKDPYQFRHDKLKHHPRGLQVLKKLAKEGNWGKPMRGCQQGIAIVKSFGTWVAQLAEVKITKGKIDVKRVTCVVDCGIAVNPDIVQVQMQGGIIFGLTAALYGDITIKDGAVQESNFHEYKMLRMQECPEIDVYVIESNSSPTGVGEPGVPPLAPAIANALAKITGKRQTQLPLKV